MKNILYIFFVCFSWQTAKAQTECSSPNFDYNGYCYDYHSNGQIAMIKEFKEGLATGIWMKFDDKGNLLLQLNTRDKKDSLGKIYSLNADNYVFEFPEVGAEFIGGNSEMLKWIQNNINYPPVERYSCFSPHGMIFLSFIVEIDGTMSNIKVELELEDYFDKEAIRVVSTMPKWKPATNNGKLVRSRVRIPVRIHLQ